MNPPARASPSDSEDDEDDIELDDEVDVDGAEGADAEDAATEDADDVRALPGCHWYLQHLKEPIGLEHRRHV